MIKRARPAKILSGDAEIKSVLSKVHIAEINVAGQHQYASGQCNSAALLLPDKNLDSLARLVTGEETCAAVCHTKDRLLVSSNKSEPRYAKQYFQILKQ